MRLKKLLLKNADAIFGDTPALLAYFYGSCAIGQSHTFSDLDIAIYLRKNVLDNNDRKMELLSFENAGISHTAEAKKIDKFCEFCLNCKESCKQFIFATIVSCPHYNLKSKRRI